MARKHSVFALEANDRAELEGWLRSATTRQSLAQRAQILLLSDDGFTVPQITEKRDCSPQRVYKWRRRYGSDGVSGLHDLPRPGQPIKLTPEIVDRVLKATTKRVPKGATHWSVRTIAEYAGITRWQVEQIWKGANLKPHRIKSFKISNDPEFAEKVIDVVGL